MEKAKPSFFKCPHCKKEIVGCTHGITYAPQACKHGGYAISKECKGCHGSGYALVAQPAKECKHGGYAISKECKGCTGSGWALSLQP